MCLLGGIGFPRCCSDLFEFEFLQPSVLLKALTCSLCVVFKCSQNEHINKIIIFCVHWTQSRGLTGNEERDGCVMQQPDSNQGRCDYMVRVVNPLGHQDAPYKELLLLKGHLFN